MSAKEVRINVRTTERIKHDLEITAELRGLTVSSLVNSLAVSAIREEKSLVPDAFRSGRESVPDRHPGNVEESRPRATNWREAFEKGKGMWKDRKDLPDFLELRNEADSRLDRLFEG